jgi:hypothetical protein
MSLSDLLLLMFVYGGAGGSGCAQDHQIGKSLFLRQAVGRLVLKTMEIVNEWDLDSQWRRNPRRPGCLVFPLRPNAREEEREGT